MQVPLVPRSLLNIDSHTFHRYHSIDLTQKIHLHQLIGGKRSKNISSKLTSSLLILRYSQRVARAPDRMKINWSGLSNNEFITDSIKVVTICIFSLNSFYMDKVKFEAQLSERMRLSGMANTDSDKDLIL